MMDETVDAVVDGEEVAPVEPAMTEGEEATPAAEEETVEEAA
jgi:hypothetical protein